MDIKKVIYLGSTLIGVQTADPVREYVHLDFRETLNPKVISGPEGCKDEIFAQRVSLNRAYDSVRVLFRDKILKVEGAPRLNGYFTLYCGPDVGSFGGLNIIYAQTGHALEKIKEFLLAEAAKKFWALPPGARLRELQKGNFKILEEVIHHAPVCFTNSVAEFGGRKIGVDPKLFTA